MSSYNDTSVDLIINRMPRSVYDQLCADHQLKSNQIYLVDDEKFDVFGKQVVNVGMPSPENPYDGVNVGYVDTYYVPKKEISAYFDRYRILSGDGSRSLGGDLNISRREVGDWEVTVKYGSVDPAAVEVIWDSNPGTGFGWNFRVNGAKIPTGNTDPNELNLQTAATIDDETVILAASRSVTWIPYDRVIAASEMCADFPTKDSLSSYYKKTETSSSIELTNAFADCSKVSLISGDTVYASDLSVVKLTNAEYDSLVNLSAISPSALYVIDDDYVSFRGQQARNLAEPTLSSDAATKKYVDDHGVELDDTVTQSSANGVKSSGIWTFVKNQIPSLAGQSYNLSVDGDFAKMCVAVARALGATVTGTLD